MTWHSSAAYPGTPESDFGIDMGSLKKNKIRISAINEVSSSYLNSDGDKQSVQGKGKNSLNVHSIFRKQKIII